MFITFDKKIENNSIKEDGVSLFNLKDNAHSTEERIIWWDLHVSPDGFKHTDPLQKEPWLSFYEDKKMNKKFIRIEPRQSVIIQTVESIKTGNRRIGIIVGSARTSIAGLLVTSGKIDPNFGPQPIALNIQNCSNQSIFLRAGDKIAAVAFSQISRPVNDGVVKGPAKAADSVIPRFIYRIRSQIGSSWRKYKSLTIGAIIFYLVIVYTQSRFTLYVDKLIKFTTDTWAIIFP